MTSQVRNLDRLAELAGIEPFYWDIWGNYYQTSEETKRSILAALGLAAGDQAAVEESLRTLEEESWRTALPPVQVIRQGEALRVPLVSGTGRASEEIEWMLLREDGARHDGHLVPADAPLLERRQVDDTWLERRALEPGLDLPPGYHTLFLPDLDPGATMSLIVAPPRCYLAPALSGGRRQWGISTQIYSLRSPTNWGIGDLTDLGDLLEKSAALGACCAGINPLHALFPDSPEQAVPYMPSSQLHLNPLYLDPVVIPDLSESKAAQDLVLSKDFTAELERARAADQVDYPAVADLKGRVLDLLHQSFRTRHLGSDSPRAAEFSRFRTERGEALRRFSVFQALTEHFGHRRWTEWPAPYRDPGSTAVAEFAGEHQERVELFEYLEWQTDRQLAMACRRAQACMDPGIFGDLAVSVAPDGADAWAEQRVIARSGRLGAPPDPFNPLGQDWGSAPLHPHELRRTAYAHFIEVLRASMRYAGALRIDHAMGLHRMFWIPAGAFPESGAYVRYPFEDLLGILALESHRNRCVVVGEDLGTVPAGFRERMAEAGALSYRVLYFEKQDGRFKRPGEYPALALACAATHDLPTLRGFLEGNDLQERFRLGLYRSESAQREEEEARARDRRQLLEALAEEDLLPAGVSPEHPEDPHTLPALVEAVHLYLARSPACLLMIQIDDLLREAEQMNLPGTVSERSNWRRKLSRGLEALAADPAFEALAKRLRAEQQGL